MIHSKWLRNLFNVLLLVVFGVASYYLFNNGDAFLNASPMAMILLIIFKISVAWLVWHYSRKVYFNFLPPIDWYKQIHENSEVQLYDVFSIVAFICIMLSFTMYS